MDFNFNRGGAKQETESVGGGRTVFDSGIYKAKIKQLYFDKYDSGAQFASVTLDIGGKDYEERLLLTNGKGESFWTDKDNNPQQYTGLTRLEELVFAAGFPNLQAAGASPANIRAWDKDAKAFVLRQHPTVMVNVHGKEIMVAVLKVNQNKQKKVGNSYVKTNEAEEVNQLDKVARLDGVTLLEAAKNISPPQFMAAWKEKWSGKTNDRFKTVKDAPNTGTPQASGGGNAPAASDDLFG